MFLPVLWNNPCFSFISVLLALSSGGRKTHPSTTTTWFIDGSNLLSHRGTPADRTTVAQQLQPVRGVDVVLVFDGDSNSDEERATNGHESSHQVSCPKQVKVHGNLETVQLASHDDLSADDYIMEQIRLLELLDASRSANTRTKIQVVTADRELRSRVMKNRSVKAVVNPVTFWKRYLPRLGDLKVKAKPPPASYE